MIFLPLPYPHGNTNLSTKEEIIPSVVSGYTIKSTFCPSAVNLVFGCTKIRRGFLFAIQISLHLSSVGPTDPYLQWMDHSLPFPFTHLWKSAVAPFTSAVDLYPCSFFRNSFTAGIPTVSILVLSNLNDRSSPPSESFVYNQSITTLPYPLPSL